MFLLNRNMGLLSLRISNHDSNRFNNFKLDFLDVFDVWLLRFFLYRDYK